MYIHMRIAHSHNSIIIRECTFYFLIHCVSVLYMQDLPLICMPKLGCRPPVLIIKDWGVLPWVIITIDIWQMFNICLCQAP